MSSIRIINEDIHALIVRMRTIDKDEREYAQYIEKVQGFLIMARDMSQEIINVMDLKKKK